MFVIVALPTHTHSPDTAWEFKLMPYELMCDSLALSAPAGNNINPITRLEPGLCERLNDSALVELPRLWATSFGVTGTDTLETTWFDMGGRTSSLASSCALQRNQQDDETFARRLADRSRSGSGKQRATRSQTTPSPASSRKRKRSATPVTDNDSDHSKESDDHEYRCAGCEKAKKEIAKLTTKLAPFTSVGKKGEFKPCQKKACLKDQKELKALKDAAADECPDCLGPEVLKEYKAALKEVNSKARATLKRKVEELEDKNKTLAVAVASMKENEASLIELLEAQRAKNTEFQKCIDEERAKNVASSTDKASSNTLSVAAFSQISETMSSFYTKVSEAGPQTPKPSATSSEKLLQSMMEFVMKPQETRPDPAVQAIAAMQFMKPDPPVRNDREPSGYTMEEIKQFQSVFEKSTQGP